jgi:hypothetical protein
MPKRSWLVPPAAVILCLGSSITPSAAATVWEIPFELRNGMIVVEGALGKSALLSSPVQFAHSCA